MANMNISLGDTVITKKLGLPVTGKVVAMWNSGMDWAIGVNYPPTIPIWDSQYPNWKANPIAFVKLNSPQRTMSKAEVATQLSTNLYGFVTNIDDDLVNWHYNQLPLLEYGTYPVDDLEKYD